MKPGALIGFIPDMAKKIYCQKNEHGFKENASEKKFLRGIFFLEPEKRILYHKGMTVFFPIQ